MNIDSDSEAMRIVPFFVESISESFHDWITNTSVTYFKNYDTITVNTALSLVNSHYKVKSSVVLRDSLLDAPNNVIDTIQFKDPWLVDSADGRFYESPYGYHNLGLSAVFKSAQSPLNLTLSSKYKGVFLNQMIASGIYYSVSAPMIQIINGYSAFFAGWTSFPNGSASFQNGSNTTTAVVFNSSGSTVIAQYKYYTLTYSTTLPSGTWSMAGTLTIPAGLTLTVNSATTLRFPSGGGLVVNGDLSANGATFKSSSGNWNGITINSTIGCSLQSCTISNASSPVTLNNTGSSVTMQQCTINSSSFGGDAAIRVNNSSPSFSLLHIDGQANSANGVRFASGSGGVLEESFIQSCGAGNGIVIQGNSSPTIEANTIQSNYYHGIIMSSNGTGNPTILYNNLDMNGVVNGTRIYTGIDFYNSGGLVQGNSIHNSNYAIYCDSYSSPNSGGTGQIGGNIITNNNNGLVATNHSYPTFGGAIPAKQTYWGVCNKIYGNVTYDAFATNYGGVTARVNWWGQYPLNPSKFYADGNSYVDNTYPETSSNGCPLNGGGAAAAPLARISDAESSPTANSNNDPTTTLGLAMQERCDGDFEGSLALYKTILDNKAAVSFHQRALVGVYNVFQASGDSSIVNILEQYSSSNNDFSIMATELLASVYVGIGRMTDAESILQKLRAQNPGTNIEKQALILLASLNAFNQSYTDESNAAFNELMQKFGSSIDRGLLAALNSGNNIILPKISNPSTTMDSTASPSCVSIENFPNPFNPTTQISYQLPAASYTTLKVYDVLGREVVTLVDEMKEAGHYAVSFDGSKLSSGIYFTRFLVKPLNGSKPIMQTRKMLLMK